MDGMEGEAFNHVAAFDARAVETGGPGGGRGCRAANEALGDRIAEQAFHLDAAMHRLLSDLRVFDTSNHWAAAGARSCASWLSWRVGWDPGTAREHLRVARALGELPLFFHGGRRLEAEPPRVVTTPLGWASIHAANRDLDIDAATGQCAWDGRPIAYGLVVDSLAQLARSG